MNSLVTDTTTSFTISLPVVNNANIEYEIQPYDNIVQNFTPSDSNASSVVNCTVTPIDSSFAGMTSFYA